MRDLPLAQLMNKPVATVSPGDTLGDASALMEQRDIHHLLVIEGGRMAGILSSADLLKLALLHPAGTHGGDRPASEALSIKVRDVMQTHVAVVRENASLRDVARALSLGGFHALPVLATDGTPVGIVTSSDLIGLLLDEIERREHDGTAPVQSNPEAPSTSQPLVAVLRAAEVYLHSGQSAQQHARLIHAVSRANEAMSSRPAN